MVRFFACCVLFAILLPFTPAQAAPRCFAVPAILACIDNRIGQFWQQHGGLAVFGYPLGAAHTEQTEAGPVVIQRFERARLEHHVYAQPPYDVQLGRLGVQVLEAQNRDWQRLPKSATSEPHYVAATGQAIAPEFWAYWSTNGLELDGTPGNSFEESVALFGMPITPAIIETSPNDGKRYLTQWFERARFEYHPEHANMAGAVQLGLLGRELEIPAATNAEPGGFLQARNNQLTRLGEAIRLKGVNYYPQWRPWADMWWDWNAPQIARELGHARDELGINAVRVLLPYNITGERNGLGKLPPELFSQLHELVQIAGDLDMRVIVTLFDFYVNFEQPGTPEFERDLAYVRAVVGAFANDERIMAWDIHNEPDHYGAWGDRRSEVQNWLGLIADEIHAIAPKQLVTVGMGQHTNLLLEGPDGRRPIDYSDLISVHIYDAGATARQLEEVQAQTNKPIIIEEFGWPTDPQCLAPNYTEATQASLYTDVVGAAHERTSGVFAWTLRDYDSPRTMRWDSREDHFGLVRADDSLKPAAAVLQQFEVAPLPSVAKPRVGLTDSSVGFPNDRFAPIIIEGTSFHVKGMFRLAWEQFGGQESFGLPIGNATEERDQNRVVQYFERAVLELDLDARHASDYDMLDEGSQIQRSIRPRLLGRSAFGAPYRASTTHQTAKRFANFYYRIAGSWRLGRAISPEQHEHVNGEEVIVQYFERGRLEWSKQKRGAQIGALGSAAWQETCKRAME